MRHGLTVAITERPDGEHALSAPPRTALSGLPLIPHLRQVITFDQPLSFVTTVPLGSVTVCV